MTEHIAAIQALIERSRWADRAPKEVALEDARIDAAIAATRDFFERMGVPTRLSAHGIREPQLDAILAKLEAHGMVKLGEHGDVTLDVSRAVLEAVV